MLSCRKCLKEIKSRDDTVFLVRVFSGPKVYCESCFSEIKWIWGNGGRIRRDGNNLIKMIVSVSIMTLGGLFFMALAKNIVALIFVSPLIVGILISLRDYFLIEKKFKSIEN